MSAVGERPVPYAVRTERLHLRAWGPADAEEFAQVRERDRAHLTRYGGNFVRTPSRAAGLQRMLHYRGQFDLDERWRWCARSSAGELVGGVSLRPHDAGVVELGWWLSAPSTGRGLATEAASALLHVAFRLWGAQRVEARMDTRNEPSRAVAERLGLACEGRLGHALMGEGPEALDLWLYALTATSYAQLEGVRPAPHCEDALGRAILAGDERAGATAL